MLTLRDISRITLLTSLIILIAATSSFAKGQRAKKSKGNQQTTKTKQVKTAPKARRQNPTTRVGGSTNSTRRSAGQRNTATIRRKVQSRTTNVRVNQPRVVRSRGVARKRVRPQRKVSVSVNKPRTVTKTVTTRVSSPRKIAVSPRRVNRKVTTVTKTQRKTVTSAKPKTSRSISAVRSRPLTKRRESRTLQTKPTTRKVRTKIEPQRKVRTTVIKQVKTTRHRGGVLRNRQRKTVVRDAKKEIRRPRVTKTNVVVIDRAGKDRRSGGRHDSHNIHHRRRISGRRPGRIFTRVVWPSYNYRVRYCWGPRVAWRYVRPHYHRKYIFVSFGGWWPTYYTPLRYSWYSWHPYRWYGCYPTAYQVTGTTNNYYTYNTYTTGQSYSTTTTAPLADVDETTFEDVRQRLAEQAAQEPEPETLADKFFEDAVKAFEQGDYETAAKALADAVVLEPNDLILPFAYAQALFADEQYYEAAEILRLGLANLPPDKEGIFFPRGLYPEDEILFGQIEQLKHKTEIFPFDADLKLLLGYQYIGIGKYDQAEDTLAEAAQYERNAEATEILLRLLEKLKETAAASV